MLNVSVLLCFISVKKNLKSCQLKVANVAEVRSQGSDWSGWENTAKVRAIRQSDLRFRIRDHLKAGN